MTVSLLGDGLYMVAIAWQVYAISNAPTALALVGVAWAVPQVLLLLLGGAVSDRFERRLLLMLSDAFRRRRDRGVGRARGHGTLELWHVVVLVVVYGVGRSLFAPAFTGIVRDVVPRDLFARGELARPVRAALLPGG